MVPFRLSDHHLQGLLAPHCWTRHDCQATVQLPRLRWNRGSRHRQRVFDSCLAIWSRDHSAIRIPSQWQVPEWPCFPVSLAVPDLLCNMESCVRRCALFLHSSLKPAHGHLIKIKLYVVLLRWCGPNSERAGGKPGQAEPTEQHHDRWAERQTVSILC